MDSNLSQKYLRKREYNEPDWHSDFSLRAISPSAHPQKERRMNGDEREEESLNES